MILSSVDAGQYFDSGGRTLDGNVKGRPQRGPKVFRAASDLAQPCRPVGVRSSSVSSAPTDNGVHRRTLHAWRLA